MENERMCFSPFASYPLSVICTHANTDYSKTMHGTSENQLIYLESRLCLFLSQIK